MADQSPLIVSIELQALLVNSAVRRQNFQRWQMNYNNLTRFTSPEPPAFDGSSSDWGTNPANDGAWLHWTLPAGLRHGRQGEGTTGTNFPLVPNRWVIVRYSGRLEGRVATGWVVESDFVDPNLGTSPYVDPYSSQLQVTSLGRVLSLNGWSEPGSRGMFLTAVGPGNVNFAAYQPYVNNVFSWHDPLANVEIGEILSYLVIGWYSDASADVLANWGPTGDFADWLAYLRWSASEPATTARSSVYEGLVFGLEWQTDNLPPSNKPDSSATTLAVANTAIDALTALVIKQMGDEAPALDPELLQAFQYDMVRLLDEPGGTLVLDRAIYNSWFGSINGGYIWEVVAANPPSGGNIPGMPDAPGELVTPDWLYELNQNQAAYDEAARQLFALQFRLYSVWWKQGYASVNYSSKYPDGTSAQQFAQALDPSIPGSLINQVKAAQDDVAAKQAQIPWGETPTELELAITSYSTAHNLPVYQQLKRSDLEHFANANDPVILIAGANGQSFFDEPDPLPCRFPDQVVTGFTYEGQNITVSTIGSTIPKPANLSAVPAIVSTLIDEFFFLDPNDATLIAQRVYGTTDPARVQSIYDVMAAHDTDIGTLPAILPASWRQPWQPLFLMWQVTFYPISFGTNEAPNWTYDGTQYTWTGVGADTVNLLSVSGRIFLTPQASFNFQSRLERYLATYPNEKLQAIDDFITETDHWDFLSQAMTGFNSQLILQNPMPLIAPDNTVVLYPPDGTLASVIGPGSVAMPMPGLAYQPPFEPWPPSGFQQFRSGQFLFQRVMVVDRFGQSVEIVNSTTSAQFKPVIGDGLLPEITVIPEEPYRFVQVTPRMLQPARLDFDFVSATDDQRILDMNAGVNPVCAWILANHLDVAIACYDPGGAALGEAYVIVNDQQQREVMWFAAPNSTYDSIASLQPDFPHLAEFLTGLQAAGADAFEAMLAVIDSTLWAIDPLGTRDDAYLSVLIGRPLALVRTRVQYELNGPPVSDPSWRFTFNPQMPASITYDFPIRFGDGVLHDDGLLGYFTGNDYTVFNAVSVPQGVSSPYIEKIGPGNFIELRFDGTSERYMTMLVDPRASVYAYTDLLPITAVAVPQQFVDSAFANMAVTFNVGPLLSDIRIPVGGGAPLVVLPQPAEKTGTWSWIQRENQAPVSYGITPSDQTVQFSNVASVLRTGWLQLAGAVSSKKSAR